MPPRQKFTPDSASQSATRLFVDRDEFRARFKQAVDHIQLESQDFLVFYGVGGQGKTALREEFQRMLRATLRWQDCAKGGVIDLKNRPQRAACYASLWARNALASVGVKTPAFDLAFAVYWAEAFAEQPLPNMPGSAFVKDMGLATDVAGEAGEIAVKEVLKQIFEGVLESVPFLGGALRRIASWSMRRIPQEVLKRTNSIFKEAWPDGEPPTQIYRQEEMLPWFLAQSLRAWQRDYPEHRFVILVDEYESVFPEGLSGERRLTPPFDAAIRELAAQIKGILWVFFTRERLPWPEIDVAWSNDLTGRQILLAGLKHVDADRFLVAVPVTEPTIRQAMIAAAQDDRQQECYPLLLDLQVSHYWEKRQAGEAVTREMFTLDGHDVATRWLTILTRFLRDYSPALKSTLTRLAVARRFDRATFAYIVRHFMTGFPIDHWPGLAALSFVEPVDDDYVLQSRIREGLIALLDAEDLRATHQALFEHFEQRAACGTVREVTLAKLEALGEAFFHRTFLSAGAAVEWLLSADSVDRQARAPIDLFEEAGLWGPLQDIDAATALVAQTPLQQALARSFSGRRLFELGALGGAETLFRQALELLRDALPPGHLDIAGSLSNLAVTLKAKGDFDGAETMHRQALELLHAALPPSHPDIAGSLNNLAETLRAEGDFDGAETMHRQALELRRAALPPGHSDIAGSLNNLAVTLKAKGDFDGAETMHRQALELLQAALPPSHPDIAGSLNNLAETLRAKGDFDGAETLHRQALELRQAALPPSHPDIAGSLNNLAETLRAKGDFDGAETMHRQALELLQAALPPSHPNIATSLNNLAATLGEKGDFDGAETMHRQALELRQAALPPGHPDIATSLNNLAATLGEKGDFDGAETMHRQALELCQAALPPGHPDIASSLNNLAETLRAKGYFNGAETLHRQALELRQAALPPGHPDIASSLNNLAETLRAKGDFDGAETLLRHALELRQAALPPGHSDIAVSLNNLATTLEDLARQAVGEGRFTQAKRLRREADKLRRG